MQVGLTWENKVRRVLPASVTVSVTLLDIASIKEADNEIDIKFIAQFEWFESRATFHNLKTRSSRNTLVLIDVKRLWIPNIIYRNNKDNDDTVSALEKSKLKIERLGNLSRSDISSLDEIEIFEGKENPISMIQSYTKPFKCNYDLRYFPFDTQVCSNKFIGNEPRCDGQVCQIIFAVEEADQESVRLELGEAKKSN